MSRSGFPSSTLPAPPPVPPAPSAAPSPRPRRRKPRAFGARKNATASLPYPIWASRHRKIRRLSLLAACMLLLWGAAAHLLPNLLDLIRYDRGTFRLGRPLSPTTFELLPADALFNQPPAAPVPILHLHALAPSPSHSFAPDRLSEWAATGPVMLLAPPAGMRGPANQLTATIYLSDGRSLNELLIREGLATPRPAPGDRLSHWFAHLASTQKINPSRP